MNSIDRLQPAPTRLSKGLPAQKRRPSKVEQVIIVSSAKGGVGKSTTAVNLAVGMASMGLEYKAKRVGLLDVDIFGPSIPRMMRLDGANDQVKNNDIYTPLLSEKNQLLPLMEYGVKCMSMGFLIQQDQPIVWRGMMVMKAIQQLLWDVDWGELDVLVIGEFDDPNILIMLSIDTPPGTGDVLLSIAQQVIIDGAIVVSTPQDVALIDAMRGMEMFKKVDVPVLGLVQNMSCFTCPHCSTTTHIFRKDGLREKSELLNVPILADIPLNADVCLSSDKGTPIVISDPESAHAIQYNNLAQKVLKILDERRGKDSN